MIKKWLKNKFYAMSFVEVLLALVFLGIVGVVIARFASSSMSKLIRDEKVEEATNYAINSDVEIQSIVSKKVTEKKSDKTLSGEGQGGSQGEEVFPENDSEAKECDGYYYITTDEDNNPILARDKNGKLMCAIGHEYGEAEVRKNCIENPAAYEKCVIKSEDGKEEFFRYIHINFPEDYDFENTDFLLADITVGQLTNEDGKTTSSNKISDYKYHTALKLTDSEEQHTIKVELEGATINNEKTTQSVIKHGESENWDITILNYTKKVKCTLSCRGEAETTLENNILHIEDVLSDVECSIVCKEDPCASYQGKCVDPGGQYCCGNGEVECDEECDPPDGKYCSDECKKLCGNGILEGEEKCEKGDPDGHKYDWDDVLCDHDTCDANCENYTIEDCGNGVVEKKCGELCDPSDPESDSPESCSDVCVPYCGNGVIEVGEDCEKGDPVNHNIKWDSPFCVQSLCKECHVSGKVKILNDNSERDLTDEEISSGRVYLDAVNTSKDVTINGKKVEVKYDDTKKMYYVEFDIATYCANNVKVELTIEYTMITGTVSKISKSSEEYKYDIVMILDVSGSMMFPADQNNNQSRAMAFASAVNDVLSEIVDNTENRLGFVTFSDTDHYYDSSYTRITGNGCNNGSSVFLQTNFYKKDNDGYFLNCPDCKVILTDDALQAYYRRGVFSHYSYKIYGSTGTVYSKMVDLYNGTFTQSGILKAMNLMLKNNVSEKRIPVYILVTDGEANNSEISEYKSCTNNRNDIASKYSNRSNNFQPYLQQSYLSEVSFITMQSAKYAKEQTKQYYGEDPFFFSLVLWEEGAYDRTFQTVSLDPSAKNIKTAAKYGTYCDLLKSITKGSWSPCTNQEKSTSGGIDFSSYSDDVLNKYSFSDGLFWGSNRDEIKDNFKDIITRMSTDTRAIRVDELKAKKVYLENPDTTEKVTINKTEYSFSDALAKGYIKEENGSYYVNLEPFIDKDIEIAYYSL